MAKKKPTKYQHLIPHLPRWPGDDPDRMATVNKTKEEILAPPREGDPPQTGVEDALVAIDAIVKRLATMQLRASAGRRWGSEFAKRWHEIRRVRDKLAEFDSSFSVLLEAYQALMLEQFENEGITQLTLDNGAPVYTRWEPRAQVKDREKYRLWCLEEGLAPQMHLAWGTTNAITKRRLLEGLPEPDGVEVFSNAVVTLRGGGDE